MWDVLSDQEAVDLCVPRAADLKAAAGEVVSAAYGRGSTDNISVILVSLGVPNGST